MMPTAFKRWPMGLLLAAALASLQGCATTGGGTKPGLHAADAEISDPLEPMNRKVFDFNMGLYDHVIEPVAKGYEQVTPMFVRTRVANFFANAGYPYIILNDFLQLRVHQGLSDVSRFVGNTLFGVGGLFDFANRFDLPPHENNLGVTLGVWGVPQGPYLVLPFFGPSSLRSLPGIPAAILASPFYYVSSTPAQWSITTLGVVNEGYTERGAVRMVKEAVFPYYFARSAWLQHQEYLIRGRALSSRELMEQLGPEQPEAPPASEKPAAH